MMTDSIQTVPEKAPDLAGIGVAEFFQQRLLVREKMSSMVRIAVPIRRHHIQVNDRATMALLISKLTAMAEAPAAARYNLSIL